MEADAPSVGAMA